jgi:hypothetical protein
MKNVIDSVEDQNIIRQGKYVYRTINQLNKGYQHQLA